MRDCDDPEQLGPQYRRQHLEQAHDQDQRQPGPQRVEPVQLALKPAAARPEPDQPEHAGGRQLTTHGHRPAARVRGHTRPRARHERAGEARGSPAEDLGEQRDPALKEGAGVGRVEGRAREREAGHCGSW